MIPPTLQPFLETHPYLDLHHPAIQEYLAGFRQRQLPEVEAARALFEWVRDEVAHSGDLASRRVTRTASEAFLHREGICYAKSHLLAALLRGAGIPAGIAYQRLTRGDTAESGHCIHALNTVYLASEGRWIRVDARGNKPGIDAQFSLAEERLAFRIRPQEGEIDYGANHAEPHPRILACLEAFDDCRLMYGTGGLPSDLDLEISLDISNDLRHHRS